MSTAYNKRKKARRKLLDQMNPERKRIRNEIKRGVLPRYSVRRGTQCVFTSLTVQDTFDALNAYVGEPNA